MKQVYLDNAAATPVDPQVFEAMQPYFCDLYANPSALYAPAVEARKVMENARKVVADFLGAQVDTVCFVSGGTESCNAALNHFSTLAPYHLITSRIEHKAVLEPVKRLEKMGVEVAYLEVGRDGVVDLKEFKNALRVDTRLVSVMYVNNEVGSVQPIADIGREILKWRKRNETIYPLFHVDACQATNYLDMNVERLHVDLMSLNGSKIYGPKGVGVLYKRRGVEIEPLIIGGGQESGLRSGTENVGGVVGMAKALELIKIQDTRNKIQDTRYKIQGVGVLRDYFWDEIKTNIEGVELNGPEFGDARICNNLNVYFEGVEAEALILYLDAKGIYCSAGSACSAESEDGSYVLSALGYDEKRTRGSVRFTLGRQTTKEDIDYVMECLPGVVERVRGMRKVGK